MKNQIEVLLSPLLLPNFELEGKVVVIIDVLRATSTISAALYNGAKAVIPVVSTEEALAFDRNSFLIAGERNGKKAEGFDFGNSPLEYSKDVVDGNTVVLTTTNGTKCIHASSEAAQILTGSFTNASNTYKYLLNSKRDIVLFCSGWKNKVNLEDTLFAGYLVEKLRDSFDVLDDSAELAFDLYQTAKSDLIEYTRKASHPKRFERLGNTTDLEVCMDIDRYPVTVLLNGDRLINA